MSVRDQLMLERVTQEAELKKSSFFWGKVVSYFSIFHALFLLVQPDFILVPLDTYLLGINQRLIGGLLIVVAVTKLVGIYFDSDTLRVLGIIGLSGVWGVLFTLSLMWSFGIGYPSNTFLSAGFMLVAILRVAYKGVFYGRLD